jgi:methylmalonyl-CoA mutase cobalamin-binding subunit
MGRAFAQRMGASPMRDNGAQYAQADCGLQSFSGLAQEALNVLVSVRGHDNSVVKQNHLDHLLLAVLGDQAFDPARFLDGMEERRLSPETVAFCYVPEAARRLGEQWLADEISFVDVTVGTERLHGLVREVDETLEEPGGILGPSALILVAEAEQHTLGAFVLALHLRAAGFSAVVRVAPVASELTILMAANRFDLALVSLGCSAALESGVGLVRTLRLLSRGEMCIFVGGSIPLSDEKLLAETGADRALRDVSALVAEYHTCLQDQALERDGGKVLSLRRKTVAKGD